MHKLVSEQQYHQIMPSTLAVAATAGRVAATAGRVAVEVALTRKQSSTILKYLVLKSIHLIMATVTSISARRRRRSRGSSSKQCQRLSASSGRYNTSNDETIQSEQQQHYYMGSASSNNSRTAAAAMYQWGCAVHGRRSSEQSPQSQEGRPQP